MQTDLELPQSSVQACVSPSHVANTLSHSYAVSEQDYTPSQPPSNYVVSGDRKRWDKKCIYELRQLEVRSSQIKLVMRELGFDVIGIGIMLDGGLVVCVSEAFVTLYATSARYMRLR